MCINDWRLGRYMRTNLTGLSVTNGANSVILSNRQRVGILVSILNPDSLAGGHVRVMSGAVGVGVINTFNMVNLYTLTSHGDLPTRQFELIASVAGPVSVGITEFTLPEEYLEAGYKEWITQHRINP